MHDLQVNHLPSGSKSHCWEDIKLSQYAFVCNNKKNWDIVFISNSKKREYLQHAKGSF